MVLRREAKCVVAMVLPWYTQGMKTAISLPDDLFASADALARRLGVSRSGLVAAALAEYVAKHRSAKISERLDAVYAHEESRVDRALSSAQRQALEQSEW